MTWYLGYLAIPTYWLGPAYKAQDLSVSLHINCQLTQVNHHLMQLNHHLTQVNHHITQVNHHLTQVNHQLTQVNHHITQVNDHLTQVNHQLCPSVVTYLGIDDVGWTAQVDGRQVAAAACQTLL